MIERVLRKVNAGRLMRKVKSAQELNTVFPLDDLRRFLNEAQSILKEPHRDYVTRISSPGMAASLELAATFYGLCRLQRSHKILDLGSGFSSFVSRRFAADHPTTITWSVDDNVEWLQKTIAYLQQHHVDTSHCYSLESFVSTAESDFDGVLLDLNFVEVREKYLQQTIDRCQRGGWILFDDVHKPDYRYEVLKCADNQIDFYDLRSFTEDAFGRYAFLGIKK